MSSSRSDNGNPLFLFKGLLLGRNNDLLEYIGKGSYNTAYYLLSTDPSKARVVKVPLPQQDRVNAQVSSSERFICIWNEINQHKGLAERYIFINEKGEEQQGASVPYINGNPSESDEANAETVLDVYRRTRRVILDAFVHGNIIHEASNDDTPIDFDVAYHRHSPTQQLLVDNQNRYYENHASDLFDDFYEEYFNDDVPDLSDEQLEEAAVQKAKQLTQEAKDKDQVLIDQALENRVGDILDSFNELYYLDMGERVKPEHIRLGFCQNAEVKFPKTVQTIQTLLYIERHVVFDNIIDDYITREIIDRVYEKFYKTKTPVTIEALNKLVMSKQSSTREITNLFLPVPQADSAENIDAKKLNAPDARPLKKPRLI